MRDYETAAGVATKWAATPAIVAAVLGGLHEAPGPEPRPDEGLYATIVVKKDGRPNQVSACGEIDFRRATINVFGSKKSDVAAAMRVIDAELGEQELDIENADWMRTERPPEASGGSLDRADATQAGEVWKGTLEYRIWTSRPKSPAPQP